MITTTSLKHPRVQSAIREALFGAALNIRKGDHKGICYAERADGTKFMRVDFLKVKHSTEFATRYWSNCRRVDIKVMDALGEAHLMWCEHLANELAMSAVTEKVWS